MAGPAPTKFLQYTKDQDEELRKKVADNSTKAGHPVTAADVNPEDNSPLKAIEEAMGDTTHVVGSTVDEWVGGASDTARVRTAKGKVPSALAAIRRLKQKLMKKAA